MAEDSFSRNHRLYGAWALQNADQALQEFRLKCNRWPKESRDAFRQLMVQATALSRQLDNLCSFMALTIETFQQDIDPEEGVTYEGFGRLGPEIILRALDAWDRGEEFTPGAHEIS